MSTRRLFIATSLALLAAGCGGGGSSDDQANVQGASYNGTTLAVNGHVYPREAQASTSYAPGQVIAFPRETQIDAARAALRQLDLTFTEQGTTMVWFIVYVPTTFEAQWAKALRELGPFENATLNEAHVTQ